MKDGGPEPDCRKCGKYCETIGFPPFLQQLGDQGIHLFLVECRDQVMQTLSIPTKRMAQQRVHLHTSREYAKKTWEWKSTKVIRLDQWAT